MVMRMKCSVTTARLWLAGWLAGLNIDDDDDDDVVVVRFVVAVAIVRLHLNFSLM